MVLRIFRVEPEFVYSQTYNISQSIRHEKFFHYK